MSLQVVIESQVTNLLNDIQVLLHQYIFNHYSALATRAWQLLGMMMVIGMSLYAYDMWMGKSTITRGTVAKYAIFVAIAVSMMAGYTQFVGQLYDFVFQLPISLGDWLATTNGYGSFSHAHTLGQAIGHLEAQFEGIMMNEFSRVFTGSYATLKFHGIDLIGGILTFILGSLIMFIALAEIIGAQVIIAFCFASLPLFICFGMVKQTQGLLKRFVMWMLGASFLLLLVPALLALIIQLDALVMIKINVASTASYDDLYALFVVGVVSIFLLLKINGVASSIVGSQAGVSGTGAITGAVGAAVGFATGGLAKSKMLKGKLGKAKEGFAQREAAASKKSSAADSERRIHKWVEDM